MIENGDRVLLDGEPGTVIGCDEHPDYPGIGVIDVRLDTGIVHWVHAPAAGRLVVIPRAFQQGSAS